MLGTLNPLIINPDHLSENVHGTLKPISGGIVTSYTPLVLLQVESAVKPGIGEPVESLIATVGLVSKLIGFPLSYRYKYNLFVLPKVNKFLSSSIKSLYDVSK